MKRFTLHGFVHDPDRHGSRYKSRNFVAYLQPLIEDSPLGRFACAGRAMDEQQADYDHNRYRQLLAEAVNEAKRIELIEIMIREKARDRLEAQRMADRVAMTAMTVARVLAPGGRRDNA